MEREFAMLGEHFPHDLRLLRSSVGTPTTGEWVRSVLGFLSRRLCAMRGHDLFVHVETHRLSLRCRDCSWESPGWLIDRPRFSYEHGQAALRNARTHAESTRGLRCGDLRAEPRSNERGPSRIDVFARQSVMNNSSAQ